MNALGAILILFIGISLITVITLLLNIVIKDEGRQKLVFYFTAAWSMVIAWLNAGAQPSNFIAQQVTAWAIGGVAAAALIYQLYSRTSASLKFARITACTSMVAGAVYLYLA